MMKCFQTQTAADLCHSWTSDVEEMFQGRLLSCLFHEDERSDVCRDKAFNPGRWSYNFLFHVHVFVEGVT